MIIDHIKLFIYFTIYFIVIRFFLFEKYVRSNGFCKSYVVLEAHGNEQTFFL